MSRQVFPVPGDNRGGGVCGGFCIFEHAFSYLFNFACIKILIPSQYPWKSVEYFLMEQQVSNYPWVVDKIRIDDKFRTSGH